MRMTTIRAATAGGAFMPWDRYRAGQAVEASKGEGGAFNSPEESQGIAFRAKTRFAMRPIPAAKGRARVFFLRRSPVKLERPA